MSKGKACLVRRMREKIIVRVLLPKARILPFNNIVTNKNIES
jgi:hypothetical protein